MREMGICPHIDLELEYRIPLQTDGPAYRYTGAADRLSDGRSKSFLYARTHQKRMKSRKEKMLTRKSAQEISEEKLMEKSINPFFVFHFSFFFFLFSCFSFLFLSFFRRQPAALEIVSSVRPSVCCSESGRVVRDLRAAISFQSTRAKVTP